MRRQPRTRPPWFWTCLTTDSRHLRAGLPAPTIVPTALPLSAPCTETRMNALAQLARAWRAEAGEGRGEEFAMRPDCGKQCPSWGPGGPPV